MKKWNLYEFFSFMDTERQCMPQLKRRSHISARRVRGRVMAQLPQEETNSVRERAWKFGRIPAVATAAALVISGSFVTAAAANGGFQNLYERFFGAGASYTETVQNSYSKPDAEIENTLENVGVEVMGIFGDEYNIFVALDFYGINGYTLPENASFAFSNQWMECVGETDDDFGYSGTSWSTYEDGHLYTTMKINSQLDVTQLDATINFTFCGLTDHNVRSVEGDLLGYAMGWTTAEINQHKEYSAEEQQWIQDNYVVYEFEDSYYSKSDLLDCGTVSVKIPVQYPQTETVQRSVTIDGIDMELELTPWTARLTWEAADGSPSGFAMQYRFSEESSWRWETVGYAVLSDGTATPKPESLDGNPVYMYSSSGGGLRGGQNMLIISFAQPVDPENVTAVYDEDGDCIWSADS